MRTQKIIKVGNSWAVTIPQELALKHGLEPGVQVMPQSTNHGILYKPVTANGGQVAASLELKKWLHSFKKKYGPALAELAKK